MGELNQSRYADLMMGFMGYAYCSAAGVVTIPSNCVICEVRAVGSAGFSITTVTDATWSTANAIPSATAIVQPLRCRATALTLGAAGPAFVYFYKNMTPGG
jgi:hypothetical protein